MRPLRRLVAAPAGAAALDGVALVMSCIMDITPT
jgi:hypothetical protein